MPDVVDADDETRSVLAPDPRFLTHERLVAIWQGGSASVPLPQLGSMIIGRGTSAGCRAGSVTKGTRSVVTRLPNFR